MKAFHLMDIKVESIDMKVLYLRMYNPQSLLIPYIIHT